MMRAAIPDRPREKLARGGVMSLGDNELLAVLIGHGTAGLDALDVANRLLALAGGTHGLPKMDRRQLEAVTGVGPAQASRVQAAVELGRRTLVLSPKARPRFRNAQDLASFLLPQFGAHPVERFGVMLLDTRHRLLATRLVSIGTLDASVAHPREIFREALLGAAAAVAVFHNHPSGDPRPSEDDVALTTRLRQAGRVMGIDVIDHVILADTLYCSLRESEWWPARV
jgi:DNA repair protein RadC